MTSMMNATVPNGFCRRKEPSLTTLSHVTYVAAGLPGSSRRGCAAAPPGDDDKGSASRSFQDGPLKRGGDSDSTSSAESTRASEGSMIGMPSRTG